MVTIQSIVSCRYRAVVTGAMENDSGVFAAPLVGKESLTRYSVVERRFQEQINKWITIVDLEPLTGRQHQLRKHLVCVHMRPATQSPSVLQLTR
jgi:23S rRNA pseudouridine1911/1915/1917 synthase